MNPVEALAEWGHADLSKVGHPTLKENQRATVELLRRWTLREVTGVFVYGSVGTGKTALAMRAGLRMQRRGVPVLFVRTKRLLDELRDYTYAADLRETLYEAPALILDDLGAESGNQQFMEFAVAELCALFDARFDNGLSTVITTNLTGAELVNRYGKRPFSRIRGLCESIKLDGPDLRGAK